MPGRRCPRSNCSHFVVPTAGLQGGPLWRRMSTCPDSKSSHSGGAIAAMPSGLQQLLPHTTFLPMSDFPTSGTMHPFPAHGHARSDQLAARLLAAPAGLPVQQLGGACRDGTRQDPLAGLCYIKDLTCRKCPRDHPCTASRAPRTGSMDLFPLSSPYLCLWVRECGLSGRTRSRGPDCSRLVEDH